MDLFLIKKFIGVFLMPLPIILLLLLIAIFYIWRKKYAKANVFLSAGVIGFILVSFAPLPNTLLHSLERQYPQYDLANKVEYIVVLGCGHVNDRAVPITSQLSPCSLIRATEAIRILQYNPQAKIVTSGNVGRQTFSNAYMNAQFLIAMGVPSNRIIEVSLSKDTEEEAANLRATLNNKAFALVTSASHMKRAVNLFEQQGLKPIAAPTEHLVRDSEDGDSGYLLPNAQNVYKFERWWYEWMGNTWVKVKSWF
ncbi:MULTISPECIES: envelope biogenesis factor ElyC [Aliiglaciecola]|uniref:envelope biogenesis factor ElyC n=1 Tax=Aliiglaciecola TaxID=1406885 RepID=UPI001C09A33D|nr:MULTISPECIES: envelope biogenesis factor ElyC [unclassified Aliiglaciecola]MBU2876146.1 envelope biogenesis factor ElyC [Aliiglaciecola lipolytica]MDO6712240.1 envelope biogenesis factor ElyC [Aliiglaciecola sp. 2_MG-2023]MDO6753522.1 envelope biogenesis factor ElyC [Aliiglaciecola sp. 1_MG-2023]